MITLSGLFSGACFRGMAQAFDLTGGMARRRLARFRADRNSVRRALAADWAAVGGDLSIALRRYGELHGQ
jgi:hypothetical protein